MGLRCLWASALLAAASGVSVRAQSEKSAPPPPQQPLTIPMPERHPEAFATMPLRIAPDMPLVPLAHVRQRGNGPIPVVLIPGLASDSLAEGAQFGDGLWLRNAEDAVLKMIEERHAMQGPDRAVREFLAGQSVEGKAK
jgi:hypothetical protein